MTNDANQTPAADRERWIDKVQKLLAKAAQAGSEEEAATFFAKAQELMTKWEIEDAELRLAKTAGPIDWTIISRTYPLSTFSPKQDASCMNSVVRAVNLRCVFSDYGHHYHKSKPYMEVFGEAADLDRFEMLWASLSLQMVQAMRQAENPQFDRNESRRFRMGFKVGYGQRIGERLRGVVAKTVGTSLVLVGKTDAIERAMPRTKSVKMSYDPAGAAAGKLAANRADLGGTSRINQSKTKGEL